MNIFILFNYLVNSVNEFKIQSLGVSGGLFLLYSDKPMQPEISIIFAFKAFFSGC